MQYIPRDTPEMKAPSHTGTPLVSIQTREQACAEAAHWYTVDGKYPRCVMCGNPPTP